MTEQAASFRNDQTLPDESRGEKSRSNESLAHSLPDNAQGEETLAAQAQQLGIATKFLDWHKQVQQVSTSTLETLVQILGQASTAPPRQKASQEAVFDLRAQLPNFLVMRRDQPVSVTVSLAQPIKAYVRCADNHHRPLEVTQLDNKKPAAAQKITLPSDLPIGDHALVVECDAHLSTVALAVCPTHEESFARLPQPGQWGIWVQVYAMRSANSWGHGDLADVRMLAEHAASQWGADFLLLNPLHAPGPGPVVSDSPYLPSSRRFFSPLYLPIEDLPDYHLAPLEVQQNIQQLAASCKARNTTHELLDRGMVWHAKRQALQLLYEQHHDEQRQQQFEDYCREQGQDLDDFALWCALSQTLTSAWQHWPEPLRERNRDALEQARVEYAPLVRFYSWMQWLIDEQLHLTQQAARQAGMRIGLIHDLAVGAGFDSADAWAWQDVLAEGASVGAPPDAFNQLGQDWGQPPWRPHALAEAAYQPWRSLLRSLLRAGAGVRIDHILGMFRLWWVPQGQGPAQGAYVHYDSTTMLALLALEAYQAGSFVVGEDLGNVGEGVTEKLADYALMGTSLLWFERDDEGQPKPASQWRPLTMATVGTHDLPPAAGFVEGEHIRVRQRLGLLTESAQNVWQQHQEGLNAWLQVLHDSGSLQALTEALPEDLSASAPAEHLVRQIVLGLHRFVAQTPARLVGVGLPDLAGDRNMINQPGTFQEYPNWRVPLTDATGEPILLEDLLSLPWAQQVAAAVSQTRQDTTAQAAH